MLGAPISASKRLQLNIDVRKYNVPRKYLNLNNTVFPVLWLNEVRNIKKNRLIVKSMIFTAKKHSLSER